jgi:aspartate kinase
VEQQTVTGIAFAKDEAQISLRRVADRPGVSAAIFGPLAEEHINVDMIVQNVSEDGSKTDMTFTIPTGDIDKALRVLDKVKAEIGFDNIQSASACAAMRALPPPPSRRWLRRASTFAPSRRRKSRSRS